MGLLSPLLSSVDAKTPTPQHALITAQVRDRRRNTATTLSIDTAAVYGMYRVIPSAVNNYAEWDVLLDAGTFEFSLIHRQGPDRGIYTVAVAGATLGTTIDGYSSGGANSVGTITGVTVATAGIVPVRLTMASKNASSSGHAGYISGFTLSRTA